MADIIRACVGRLVGALVGALVGYLTSLGIHDLSPDFSAQLTTVLTNVAMLAGYGIAHKLTNRKVNPSDAASGV